MPAKKKAKGSWEKVFKNKGGKFICRKCGRVATFQGAMLAKIEAKGEVLNCRDCGTEMGKIRG